MVATMVRTIFAQPDPDSVWAQHRRVVDHLYDVGLTDAAEHVDQAGGEILGFTGFPKAHCSQIWSTTLNSGSKKRSDAAPTS